MPKLATIKLNADSSLTKDAFSFNDDGSVTVKNAEMSKLLKENLKAAEDSLEKEAAVGLIWT